MKASKVLSTYWAVVASALSAEEWQKQSIYQVMTDRFARTDGSTSADCDLVTYCGGTWRGLVNKLDYIQGMGFTAVWISPVVKNIESYTGWGNAYHGYWAQDIWSLNPHFGTEQDLLDLSAELHRRDMKLMLDVVTNHMAHDGCGNCNMTYSLYSPFSSRSWFHPYCTINYDNETSIETCWQGDEKVSLPDLRTEDSEIRSIFHEWIRHMVTKYSVDGLRVDSAKHVETDFWPDFEAASGVFALGEVLDGDPQHIYPWTDYLSGVMNYPVYYWLLRAFQSSSSTMDELTNGINTMSANMKTATLGSFIENHDQKRFPDMSGGDMAIAFTMLMDGIPIIYQGQEQHFDGGDDPLNRQPIWPSQYDTTAELYTWIKVLNRIRSQAVKEPGYLSDQANATTPDSHTIALRKGTPGCQMVSVYTNIGSNNSTSYAVSLPSNFTGFGEFQFLVEVVACRVLMTDHNGMLRFDMGTTPKIFYPAEKLLQTWGAICGEGPSLDVLISSAVSFHAGVDQGGFEVDLQLHEPGDHNSNNDAPKGKDDQVNKIGLPDWLATAGK
ncbi:alpha-amylase [Pseudomassariella vexata]|uniref:alpha-amylase n=1 Tax=Pseudomassariella vexata TaxID=1141098 RepID=A0A1Y2DXU1_9PEZI|nr:alpha-amylase [Pseudomassariella vexata]ORY63946.1 alpha-amylase [Pseudomassariella vexata]